MTLSIDVPIPDVTAVVLAGGRSARMGRPKSLLLFDGDPLISHIVRTLEQMFSETVIVASPAQELPDLPAILVRDEVAYQGPVGGIYYGLTAASGKFCFVTSCDVPFINRSLIRYLVSRISDCDVAVPYWEDRFQPLHAVYRTSVTPLLKEQLNRGELRPVYLFDKVRTVKIDEEQIRRFDPEGLSFFNMNTPEDYERALKRWNESKEDKAKQNPIKCTVEFFGVAQLLAKTRTFAVVLPPDATLAHLFLALAQQLPVLVGRVLSPEGGGLVSGCACNVNGLEFVRNPKAKIKAGDKVLILPADAGG